MTLRIVLLLLAVAAGSAALADIPEGYYRFPTISGNTILFASEGDLWRVDVAGGEARRITTHLADESRPAVSPDGQTVAFSGSYEGSMEVYTMPVAGGLPVRRTYEGGLAVVVGWTPDGRILYSTTTFARRGSRDRQLVALDIASGAQELIPLAQAADGAYEPSGALYFTRFRPQGSHTKQYMGGTAQSIWKFESGAGEAVELTGDYEGTSRTPMTWQGRVYFESDRDGTMNIWSMDPDGGDLQQHTFHDRWEVRSPSQGSGKIVYQLGADIALLDLASGEDRMVDIRLSSDFDQSRITWESNPTEYLDAANISPDGDKVVLTARGKVFVAPTRQGRFVEATRHAGARYRGALFAGEDELLVMSDETGEVEWWKIPANGVGEPEQISSNGRSFRLVGLASPDGNQLATIDREGDLWIHHTKTKEAHHIGNDEGRNFRGLAFSPDSRRLAYALGANNTFGEIHIFDTTNRSDRIVTSDRYDDFQPAWGADGKWLYFLSNRTFNSLVGSPWGVGQPEPYFPNQTKIYGLALTPDARWPFLPDDELMGEVESVQDDGGEGDRGDDGADADDDADAADSVVIDFDGIETRLYEVPVEAGNYTGLTVNDNRLFWVGLSVEESPKRSLTSLDIHNRDPETKTMASEIQSYDLSQDGTKILLRKNGSFYVIDASSGANTGLDDAKVDLSNWTFAIDPEEERRQMFLDSWRLERDYFYDPGMHGVDWEAIRDKYLPLVDRAVTRGDLADIQAQMISELKALHSYVYGGDFREGTDKIPVGSLGARFSKDTAAGGFRIDHIYRSDPDEPGELSPLALPHLDVSEGDVVTRVNGADALEAYAMGELLLNQAGKQVRLRLTDDDGDNERDVIVVPISTDREQDLRYDEWEYTRRLATDSLSSGSIGYVHLRAMGSQNMAEFQRHFYPVSDRQGLIIDMRANGGGNIDSWILGRLMRRAWMYWKGRGDQPFWNMQYAFRGHMVMLVDEWSASDGELVAEGFRRLGLGAVIGTRTWGGEIWLSSSNRLVDGGIATAAEWGVYGPEREWLIEGHGVDPDIVVDNLPHETFNGRDAQLEAAIDHLKTLIREDPRVIPEPPEFPILVDE